MEVQPVNLTADDVAAPAFASTTGETRSLKVARGQVGAFLADADVYVHRTVALSGDLRRVRASAGAGVTAG